MIRTIEAIVDEKGQVRLAEPIQLSRSQRALVTILDEEPAPQLHEDSLLSERALAEDWNRPEEDAAWAHLGEVRYISLLGPLAGKTPPCDRLGRRWAG